MIPPSVYEKKEGLDGVFFDKDYGREKVWDRDRISFSACLADKGAGKGFLIVSLVFPFCLARARTSTCCSGSSTPSLGLLVCLLACLLVCFYFAYKPLSSTRQQEDRLFEMPDKSQK